MAEDWTGIASEVEAAIAEVGGAATLEKQPANTGTAWSPTYAPPVTHPVKVLFDGMGGESDDKKMLVGASVAIAAGDRVQFDGRWYEIKAPVERLAPAGTTLLYRLTVDDSTAR